MANYEHSEGVPSTASIGRHPIHPMLVPFPIGFLVGALVSDVVYWVLRDAFWAQARTGVHAHTKRCRSRTPDNIRPPLPLNPTSCKSQCQTLGRPFGVDNSRMPGLGSQPCAC